MRIVSLFFLLICCSTASAQVFNAGVIAGVSGAQIEGDGYGGYNKIGFIAGGFVNTNLNDKLSSQFEIYFINKGSFDGAQPDKNDFDSFSVNLNYIEIPVSLRYEYKKFMLEVGLYYARLIGTPKLSDENGEIFIIQSPFNSYDFGGLLGIYYQINDKFILNIRSKNSLVPVRNSPSVDPTNGFFSNIMGNGWYNVDLNFTVRYQFGK